MANGSIRIDVDTSGASQNVRKLVDGFNKLSKPLPTASANLAKLVDEAKEAGKSLTTAGKDSVALATALGKVNTAAKSPRQAFSQLKQSLEEATVAYNKLSDQEKAGEFGKALKKSIEEISGRAKELKKSLNDANKSLQEYKTESKSTGGVLDALSKKFGMSVSSLMKFSTVSAAASAALKVASDAFFTSEKNVDDWGRTLSSASGLYEAFCASLNNGNLDSFFANMRRIIDDAKEAYNAMDNLQTKGGKISNQEAKLQFQLTHQMAIVNDKSRSEADRKAAQERIKQINEQMRAAKKATAELNNDVVKSKIGQLLTGQGFKKGTKQYKEAFDRVVKGLYDPNFDLGTVNVGYQSGMRINNGKTVRYTDNGNRNLNNVVTDEFLKEIDPFVKAVWSSLSEAERNTLQANRYSQKSLSGTGGKTATEAVFDENANTLKGFQDNIAVLTKTLSGLTVGSQQYMDTLKQLNEWQTIQKRQTTYNSDMQNVWNGNFGKGVSIGTQFSKMPTDDDLKKAAVVKLPKELTEWFKEEKKASKADGIGKMAQGMEGVIGGLESLGIELPSGLKEVVGGLNSIIGIITSISTILESIEIIQAATAWLPFKNGGPVHAASGIVMGNNYLDRVPATLSSGEMVMNEADQSALWKAIKSGDFGGGGTATSIVRAEDIILAVNNHGMRTGKGKLAFVKG